MFGLVCLSSMFGLVCPFFLCVAVELDCNTGEFNFLKYHFGNSFSEFTIFLQDRQGSYCDPYVGSTMLDYTV